MSSQYFEKKVEKIHSTLIFKSNILETSLKQRYMVLINKWLWYAVRILIEIDDRYYIHIYSHKVSEEPSLEKAIKKHDEIISCLSESPPNFDQLSLDVSMGVFFIVPDADVSLLRAGDHVQVIRSGVYGHSCIYLGKDRVIHINGFGNTIHDRKSTSYVRCGQYWENFMKCDVNSNPATIFIYSTIFKCRSRETIMKEALNSIGNHKGKFNYFSRNCQHFATECQTGIKKSTELSKFDLSNVKPCFKVLANSFGLKKKFTNFNINHGSILHHPDRDSYIRFNLKLIFK